MVASAGAVQVKQQNMIISLTNEAFICPLNSQIDSIGCLMFQWPSARSGHSM